MFSAIGLIGSVITLATSSVLPAIYEKAGLNAKTAVAMGYSAKNVYDVLYNTELFQSICSILIMASVVGAVLNVIPFFFYDLTETKQKAMVNVLRIRAYFEDALNGIASDEQKKQVEEIINNAKLYVNKEKLSVQKGMSKEEKKHIREDNEQIETAEIILNEINYFSTSYGMYELEYSQKLISSGGVADVAEEMRRARMLPGNTAEEKEFRRKMISLVKNLEIAEKTVASKGYKDAESFDNSVFTELFNTSDSVSIQINDLQKKIKSAKENRESADGFKTELSRLYKIQKNIDAEIKKVRQKSILYNRVNKPLIDAKKCVARYESYRDYMKMV